MRPVVPARRDAYVLRMFLGRYPKDYVPRFFAKAQVQANYMQWNLSEVLQCAQIFFMCSVRIRLYRPIPIPTYNLNLFPSSLDMTYRMVTNFTLCPKKNE